MTTSNEKPIILVVVTFFLALVLVYIVYFRVQWSKNANTTDITTTPVTQSGSQFASSNFWTWDTGQDTSNFNINTGTVEVGDLTPLEQKIRELSSRGIRPWYASITVAEQLGLAIDFAFTDEFGIQYGYLGTWLNIELAPVVRRLWWNVLAIQTRNDIVSNLLRWDRISFVNIPGTTFVQQQWTEQRLLVAMIVDMDGDRRFVQSTIDQYYAHKADMKAHFESLYNKVR